MSRRLREGAGSWSGLSVERTSAAERREADLFFADLVGPAALRLTESVRGETPSPEDREADLFWNDLLGPTPTSPGQRRIRGELPPIEWTEQDDADRPSILGEAFGSDHVRISLRNDDGTAAAGIAYRAQFRNGHIVNGTLDARGEATIPDHTHGDVQVTFPGLPAASWEISSFGGSGG